MGTEMAKSPSDTEPVFEMFWAKYPRRVAKRAAQKAWDAAVKRADPNDIIAGLRRYQFSPDPQYRPHPATWLNGDRWIVDDDDGLDPVLVAVGLTANDLERA